MATGPRPWADRMGPIVLALILILGGIAWLLGSLLNLDLGHYGWPLFIIVPGLVLLAGALATPSDGAIGLAVAGSVVLATGLLLAVQNVSGWWASWAYAWALIAPGGVGAGLMLAGARLSRPQLVRNGARSALVGLGLFAAGFIFFEGLLGIDGRALLQLNGALWGVLLIAVGALWLAFSLLRRGPAGPANLR